MTLTACNGDSRGGRIDRKKSVAASSTPPPASTTKASPSTSTIPFVPTASVPTQQAAVPQVQEQKVEPSEYQLAELDLKKAEFNFDEPCGSKDIYALIQKADTTENSTGKSESSVNAKKNIDKIESALVFYKTSSAEKLPNRVLIFEFNDNKIIAADNEQVMAWKETDAPSMPIAFISRFRLAPIKNKAGEFGYAPYDFMKKDGSLRRHFKPTPTEEVFPYVTYRLTKIANDQPLNKKLCTMQKAYGPFVSAISHFGQESVPDNNKHLAVLNISNSSLMIANKGTAFGATYILAIDDKLHFKIIPILDVTFDPMKNKLTTPKIYPSNIYGDASRDGNRLNLYNVGTLDFVDGQFKFNAQATFQGTDEDLSPIALKWLVKDISPSVSLDVSKSIQFLEESSESSLKDRRLELRPSAFQEMR
jgi:hypothetical protein